MSCPPPAPSAGTPPNSCACCWPRRPPADTKTVKSRRTLALPKRCVEAFGVQRRQQDDDRRAAGRRWQSTGLVFTSKTGGELDAANVRRAFRRVAKLAGLDPAEWTPRAARHDLDYVSVERLANGRLPCMVSPEFEVRRLKLSNGAIDVGGVRFSFARDESFAEKAAKRYGIDRPAALKEGQSIVALADWCMNNARAMIQRDRHHGWFVMLFKGIRLVNVESLMARDRPDKIVLMRELADAVERSGIDGIIEIGDAWMATMKHDEEGFPIAPALNPDRMEALTVVAEDAYGNRRQLFSPYARKGRSIKLLGDPIDISGSGFANNLQPIRQAWARMGLGQSPSKQADV